VTNFESGIMGTGRITEITPLTPFKVSIGDPFLRFTRSNAYCYLQSLFFSNFFQ